MEKIQLEMVKGDTFSFVVHFEGLTEDLASAYFTLKTLDKTQVLQKTLNSGITKLQTGYYKVRIAPADTANINPDRYKYDMQVGIGNDIYTILLGYFTIIEDVTTS